MSAPAAQTTTASPSQAPPIGDDAPAAAPSPPPPWLGTLNALYAGYNYDYGDGAFDEDEDNAFGDAFTVVLARVPQLMGAVVAWADGLAARGGGDRGDGGGKAAAEALDALSADPLLPDDVLGGERWLDLCAALPVCLFSGGGSAKQEEEEEEEEGQAAAAPSAAAARLLRFLAPALLAGSGGCADALATVLIPLLDYMAKTGASRHFAVRRHAEAAAQAAAAATTAAATATATATTPGSLAEAPDAIAMQFALVGLDRLGRQWHLLDPGLGPGLAAAVCALLAAPLSLGEAAGDDAAAPAATAAQALLAWDPDAAWWHRLCAATAPSLDLAAAAATAGEGEEEGEGGRPAPWPLLRALVRWRRWGGCARALSPSSSSPDDSDPSLEAVAAHALAGVLDAPALRRAALEEEGREQRRGGGGGDGAPPPPPPPLWDALLQLGAAAGTAADQPPPAPNPRLQEIAAAARAAARAVVARLAAGHEVPPPAPPAGWGEAARAAAVAPR